VLAESLTEMAIGHNRTQSLRDLLQSLSLVELTLLSMWALLCFFYQTGNKCLRNDRYAIISSI
jgi:hypothetical protein